MAWLGVWLFSGFIYQGQHFPRPNPDLIMTLEFLDQEHNRLHWHRTDQKESCTREALYQIEDDRLKQTIVYLDPDNASSCSQDPDMQLGAMSETRMHIDKDEMHLFLSLGNEELETIWKRNQ